MEGVSPLLSPAQLAIVARMDALLADERLVIGSRFRQPGLTLALLAGAIREHQPVCYIVSTPRVATSMRNIFPTILRAKYPDSTWESTNNGKSVVWRRPTGSTGTIDFLLADAVQARDGCFYVVDAALLLEGLHQTHASTIVVAFKGVTTDRRTTVESWPVIEFDDKPLLIT